MGKGKSSVARQKSRRSQTGWSSVDWAGTEGRKYCVKVSGNILSLFFGAVLKYPKSVCHFSLVEII